MLPLHITPPRSYANGNAMALDDLDTTRVNLRWLYYFLLLRGFADVISGSAQPQITQSSIGAIKLSLPDLKEQERIVQILDETEALHRLRAQADARTGMLIQANFEHMF